MDDRAANRTGRVHLLAADDETLDLLREFGRRGFAKTECARRLDVHVQTYRSFLRREPAAIRAFESGLAERRERLRADNPGRAGPPKSDAPKVGETCPTCGGRVGPNENAIVLTAAELADARRRLEDIIDRHIAARRRAKPGRPEHSRAGGAETGR